MNQIIICGIFSCMCTTDELELMFNRLVSQPLKGKVLPNDNSRNLNSSNPIIHHLDDSPLPVAKGSCEPSAGNSNSNLLQNPEDNDPKIEESESEQADVLEIDAGVRFWPSGSLIYYWQNVGVGERPKSTICTRWFASTKPM